jgi:DNA (cytosine-5)-methyltransferase 1
MNLLTFSFGPPPAVLCHRPVSVLSLFPGVGLFDLGFETLGFSVVRGPDQLWHGDIVGFTVPPGCFDGVIAGPPCQDFSRLRRSPPTGNGLRMLAETRRVISDAAPLWWIVENVPACPDVEVFGYSHQRFILDASHCGAAQRRLRKYQIGRKFGLPPIPLPRGVSAGGVTLKPCPVANDSRPVGELAVLQGLPETFTLPSFTREGARRAIGNGVPFQVSLQLAEMVQAWLKGTAELSRPCICGCGRNVTGAGTTASVTCRKKLQRRRDREAGIERPSRRVTLDSHPAFPIGSESGGWR